MTATLTLVTAKRPARLSKGFELQAGALMKIPGGQLVDGTAERLTLKGVEDLAALLGRLTPAQALVYGVCAHETARVLTADELARVKRNGGPPLVARTREYFAFRAGEGILMLDHDPGKAQEPLTADELRASLYKVCPPLEQAPHVLTASASSFIYQGERCLRGPAGWRVLFLAQDVSDVPRAGAALFQRAWLRGLGRIEVSAAGSLLIRGLLDDAVFQPERLDFCGGAACKPPLEQRRPAPKVFNADAEPLDTRQAIPSLTLAEQAEFRRLVDEARNAARPEAEKVQAEWIDRRVEAGLAGVPEAEREQRAAQLRETYQQAVKGQTLLADFPIRLASGETVTVGEMLDDPDRYHGKRCADPLEPDGPDQRPGYINLRAAGRPYIYSHLHGGRRFALHRARQTIRVVPGERPRAVQAVFELMRVQGSHYGRGGEIVKVTSEGAVVPRDREGLLFDLDVLARWERFDRRAEDWRPCDCPPSVAAGAMAARGETGLPELLGVATAPVLDPVTGRLIDQDGFDREARLLLILPDMADWPGVSARPSGKEVEMAVRALWRPFENFPFCGPVDRGVMLTALLTVSVRPLLPTAPAIAFDAPTAGSGKSLLARCCAELAGEENPAMLPAADNAEEVRKRLLASLRQGKLVTIIDNVAGVLDSAALCTVLTSPRYEDRILGASENIAVPTNTVFVVTGNNLALRGDLCRRVLTARLDPGVGAPWKRRFNLDPAEYVRRRRFELVASALTVLRAGMQHGPILPDRTASFELWSDTVRRAVCWIGAESFLAVDDPVKSIDAAFEMDPETAKLGGLLGAWHGEFRDLPVTVAELIKAARNDEGGPLFDALDEVAGERGSVNPRKLGRWIEKRRERIVGEKKIERAGMRDGRTTWRVKWV
ncbi:conserved hypothetical protein [uncultured Desulfatiglans sp.]|nr:conserved hypothetical protein [uncultured Desulfatiglans sp.]